MTRLVYDNRMVAHIWANQSQNEARSHNGNFWFRGKSIYSYRTEIARLVTTHDGRTICLRDSRKYSMTTSGKHDPAISRALQSDTKVYWVPHVSYPNDSNNVAHLQAQYARVKAQCLHSISTSYGSDKRDWLNSAYTVLCNYRHDFALKFELPNLEADLAEINAKDAKRNTPEAIAKRERDRCKRQLAQMLKDQAATLHKAISDLFHAVSAEGAYGLWKADNDNNSPPSAYEFAFHDPRRAEIQMFELILSAKKNEEKRADWLTGKSTVDFYQSDPVLLRIRGDQLETSQGANVPLEHAIRAFRFIRAVRARSIAWHRNGHSVRVGHFQLDSIDADGNVKAGCHRLTWDEIARVAGLLGLGLEAEPQDESIAA